LLAGASGARVGRLLLAGASGARVGLVAAVVSRPVLVDCAEREVGAVPHHDEWALREAQVAPPIVANDLYGSHAVAHRSARVIVHAQAIGVTGGVALDCEALRPIAGGDVAVERSATGEGGFSVECMCSGSVVDVQVDIVRIGFPGQPRPRPRSAGRSFRGETSGEIGHECV
jgi:hypothetical protein